MSYRRIRRPVHVKAGVFNIFMHSIVKNKGHAPIVTCCHPLCKSEQYYASLDSFLLYFFQSWPLASEQHHSKLRHPACPPDPPSRYSLPLHTVDKCELWLKSASQFNPIMLLLHPLLQSPIKAWKVSEPGQPECTKRRARREEQCLSNTEWVDGHICPCRVCGGEREMAGGRCSGHSLFSVGRPYASRFV